MEHRQKQQCTAKSKQSGERCKNWTSIGKMVCKFHGGKSTGPPKDNQNAKTHGVYSKLMSNDDREVFQIAVKALDSLDDTIGNNAVLYARSLKLSNSDTTENKERGLRLAGEAIGRERRLKMSRHELRASQETEDDKPLPWVDD